MGPARWAWAPPNNITRIKVNAFRARGRKQIGQRNQSTISGSLFFFFSTRHITTEHAKQSVYTLTAESSSFSLSLSSFCHFLSGKVFFILFLLDFAIFLCLFERNNKSQNDDVLSVVANLFRCEALGRFVT